MGDAGIPSPPTVFNDRLRDVGTRQLYRLGTERVTFDGDIYVYVKAGSTALAAGRFMTYLTTGGNEQTVTVAHAIGTTRVKVAEATATHNAYEDGYLVVTAGTGIGECYRIKGNQPSDGTNTEFELYEGLATAWSTSDTDVTVYKNRYNGLIVNPNDAQQRPVCLTQWPIAANSYGWALKKGFGALNIEVLAAGGAELDEKPITAAVTDATNAGRGTITGSGVTTMYGSADSEGDFDDTFSALSSVYLNQPILAYVVKEADCTDDEATLVAVDL